MLRIRTVVVIAGFGDLQGRPCMPLYLRHVTNYYTSILSCLKPHSYTRTARSVAIELWRSSCPSFFVQYVTAVFGHNRLFNGGIDCAERCEYDRQTSKSFQTTWTVKI